MDATAILKDTGRWLKKANAKAVFVCLLVSLLVTSGLWVFKLMSDVRDLGISASTRGSRRPNLPLGILDLVASVEQTLADSFPSVSPFAGAPARPRKWRKPPKSPPKRLSPPPKRAPKAAVNRPETVSLIYKGIFKRSDGVNMALIEDSKSGSSSFYKLDSNLFGMSIQEIGSSMITITQEDGETMELPMDQSAVFVEGKHAP